MSGERVGVDLGCDASRMLIERAVGYTAMIDCTFSVMR